MKKMYEMIHFNEDNIRILKKYRVFACSSSVYNNYCLNIPVVANTPLQVTIMNDYQDFFRPVPTLALSSIAIQYHKNTLIFPTLLVNVSSLKVSLAQFHF